MISMNTIYSKHKDATLYKEASLTYTKHGKLHRIGGPAFIWTNGEFGYVQYWRISPYGGEHHA